MKYRVQCATYNGHLSVGSLKHPGSDVAAWLGPTLQQTRSRRDGDFDFAAGETSSVSTDDSVKDAPDFFAVGFQEMIGLHLALAGMTRTALDAHDHEIKAAIESHTSSSSSSASLSSSGKSSGASRETYTLMAKETLGGIALLVYTRDRTVTNKVADVRVATAACGIGRVMGNKGGVGVRIVLDADDDQDGSSSSSEPGDGGVFTFVTAHLAAHDKGLQRRNQDYQSIVERLVFSRESESAQFRPTPRRRRDVFRDVVKGESVEGYQVYDTSYLFVFGDLNYRLSLKQPRPLPLHLISHKIQSDIPSLFTQDTLRLEQSAGRTLHHLREGPITFLPTYKFKVGTVDTYKSFKKRVPGWTDRILYATWADGPHGAGTYVVRETDERTGQVVERTAKRKSARVESYTSVMEFVQSDHKPVTAVIALPRHPKPREGGSHQRQLRLPNKSPFKIDSTWRRKKWIGWVLDRIVGYLWCLIMLAGFNRDTKIGILNLTLAGLATYHRRALLGI